VVAGREAGGQVDRRQNGLVASAALGMGQGTRRPGGADRAPAKTSADESRIGVAQSQRLWHVDDGDGIVAELSVLGPGRPRVERPVAESQRRPVVGPVPRSGQGPAMSSKGGRIRITVRTGTNGALTTRCTRRPPPACAARPRVNAIVRRTERDRRIMKRIILVTGMPDAGKSCLTDRLVREFSLEPLSVDEAYVAFVKAECPMLYFDALHLYIAPHHNWILADRNRTKAYLGRDCAAEWGRYLINRIQGLAALHDAVVVEGYLLEGRDSDIRQAVASAAAVFVVSVQGGRCFCEGRELTAEAVAALGT